MPKQSPLTIVVDTREQQPYPFPEYQTIKKALLTGDYSVDGAESYLAVERKSLNDFVQSVVQNRKRFYQEVERLQIIPYCCIVIEGALIDILRQEYASNAHPNSIIGSINSIIGTFRVPIILAGNRQAARFFTERFLVKYG